MFSKLRIFPISGFNATTGAPTISTAVPLLAVSSGEQEINNISCELTPVTESREWKADNKTEKDEVKTRYDGVINFYGFDKTALEKISNNVIDGAGHTVLGGSPDGNPKVVLFYHGKSAKGKAYNIWLYNVEFGEAPFKSGQDGDTPEAASLNFSANSITYTPQGGSPVTCQGIIVWEGTTGYIAEGTEPTAAGIVYPTPANTSQGS